MLASQGPSPGKHMQVDTCASFLVTQQTNSHFFFFFTVFSLPPHKLSRHSIMCHNVSLLQVV